MDGGFFLLISDSDYSNLKSLLLAKYVEKNGTSPSFTTTGWPGVRVRNQEPRANFDMNSVKGAVPSYFIEDYHSWDWLPYHMNRVGSEPFRVTFSDISESQEEIVSWLYDFGDGKTSTERVATHTYTEAGNYTVSLTVWEEDGDLSVMTRPDLVIIPEPLILPLLSLLRLILLPTLLHQEMVGEQRFLLKLPTLLGVPRREEGGKNQKTA
jgi:hypothetical protein